MSNTYAWSYISHTTRQVSGVKSRANPAAPPATLTVIDTVTFACASANGGEVTDHIILGDPVSVESAITPQSPVADILAAAVHALGLGGVQRRQALADNVNASKDSPRAAVQIVTTDTVTEIMASATAEIVASGITAQPVAIAE